VRNRLGPSRADAAIGFTRISFGVVTRPLAIAVDVTIDPNEWPSTTAVPLRPSASRNPAYQAAYPGMSCPTSVSGDDSPKPGRSGPMMRMSRRCAITGSRPWCSPRYPCEITIVVAASSGPYTQ
jgi:hypothetical protein